MSGRFVGWEIYPRNLSFSALDTDTTRCQEELSKDAQRLFIPDEEESELQILQADMTAQEGLYFPGLDSELTYLLIKHASFDRHAKAVDN